MRFFRRPLLGASLVLATGLILPPVASAHGLVIRGDLPIPDWLFGWAAAAVLVVSFVAIGVLWRTPRLQESRERPLPDGLSAAVTSPVVEVVCGAIGTALLVVVVWSGLAGAELPTENFAPTFIFVIFWLGFVPASVLFGDVFRAFNPWRAVGRVVGGLFSGAETEPLPYPQRLGRWPAVIGLLAFAWLELVSVRKDDPSSLAHAVILYSAVTWAAMGVFGVEAWTRRGEAFSVYFNLFSRLSPVVAHERRVYLRPPLSGLPPLKPWPGTVAVLVVMIGTVSFDGASGGKTWQSIFPDLVNALEPLGLTIGGTAELAYTIGLFVVVLAIGAIYLLGCLGARLLAGGDSTIGLARTFAHSLVPIALAYAAAHYASLLLLQGQAILPLASDPLGHGWDLFGTAAIKPNLAWLSGTTVWYLQVGFVVAGHVAALALAHDRALVLYRDPRRALRSQYCLLAVMVGFTLLALWLLSEVAKG